MNDLISRSALLESLIHCDALGRKSFEAVIKHINEQPTVYDLDKVVERLEEKALGGIHGCQWIPLESAIDIVRGGGVNE